MKCKNYWSKGLLIGVMISIILIITSEILFWISNPEPMSVGWYYMFMTIFYPLVIITSLLGTSFIGSLIDLTINKKKKPIKIISIIFAIYFILMFAALISLKVIEQQNNESRDIIRQEHLEQYLKAKVTCESENQSYWEAYCLDKDDSVIKTLTFTNESMQLSNSIFNDSCEKFGQKYINEMEICLETNGFSSNFYHNLMKNCSFYDVYNKSVC